MYDILWVKVTDKLVGIGASTTFGGHLNPHALISKRDLEYALTVWQQVLSWDRVEITSTYVGDGIVKCEFLTHGS